MSIRNGTISPELEARYLEPYTYTLKHWGNQIAPKLIEPFNYWFKLPQEKLEFVREVMVMLYNACVLLDDIQDNSAFRAGLPVAHHVYGIPMTINAATAVYFLAIEKLLEAFPTEAPSSGVHVLTKQWRQMHRGQGAEMYWREAFLCPSEEEYLELATIKSGCFIALIIDLMQLFSEDRRDYTPLYRVMSMYLQIANDYESFKEKEVRRVKP